MEHKTRMKSLEETRTDLRRSTLTNVVLAICLLMAIFGLVTQKKILQTQVPGMPDGATISSDTADRAAQFVVVQAVTSAIASINPSNAEAQKRFIKAFLAPDSYTNISVEIDKRVKQMEAERELGSYYWVLTKGASYDPILNRFFVVGEVHTVNAAKDTGKPYVFEYSLNYENYRPVIHDVISYEGDKPHNSEWQKSNTKVVK